MEQIEIRGLRKAYTTHSTEILIDHEARPSRTRTVLRDLNVNFPAGRISVLVGRSGCGKSTLLRLINREEEPDGGEIRLPTGWRSVLLGANPYVITWTSVLRNVAMASGVGKTPEERLEHAADFVRLVGLEEFSDLTPDELSTGMKQRLGLARVLASQAQLLLMDEPFAALDFLTRAELQAELLHLQRRLPRTILLVTHQLDEALLLGVLGGRRLEHTLANLCTGLGLEQRGVRATLLDERSRITFVRSGETRAYPKEEFFYFSAFPMEGRAEGVWERGSYYELTDDVLVAGYPLGVSNEYAEGSDCITVSTRQGALVVVETIAD